MIKFGREFFATICNALLSVPGEILALVFLDRLLPLTEEIVPENQCGFRLCRGTTDTDLCSPTNSKKMPGTKQ